MQKGYAVIRAEDIRGHFGTKHDMKSPCPVDPEVYVRVRVAGLNHTFIGRAKEFHWLSQETLNPQRPREVDTRIPGIPRNCQLAQSTVAEYAVLPYDSFATS